MSEKPTPKGGKVPLISNIAASALGAWAINWASTADLPDHTQTAILSSIPPLVLLLAWLIKSIGFISRLSVFEIFMSLANNKEIKELKSIIDDPYIPEQRKEALKERYYEAKMLRANIWADRVKLSSKGRDKLHNDFSQHLQPSSNKAQENQQSVKNEECDKVKELY